MTSLIRSSKTFGKHYRGFYYIIERRTYNDGYTIRVYYFDGHVFDTLREMQAFIDNNYLN